MLSGMTHEQFNEWVAKDIIEPIGSTGIHTILARIGVLIATLMGNQNATEAMFADWRNDTEPEADTETVFNTLEATAGAVRT